jgi:CheY-like chemotaxis protein
MVSPMIPWHRACTRSGSMLRDLGGLRVLVASDDSGLGRLFATIVEICGGTVQRADSAATTFRGLERRPHVLLLDVAMPEAVDMVPLGAEELKIPVVAFLFRHTDPAGAAARLRGTHVRLLASTDVFQVCSTLQRAVAEAA